jgi:hypothetical protein
MATEYIFVIPSNSYEIVILEKFTKMEEEKIKPENKRQVVHVAQRPLKRLNARSGNSCRPRDR